MLGLLWWVAQVGGFGQESGSVATNSEVALEAEVIALSPVAEIIRPPREELEPGRTVRLRGVATAVLSHLNAFVLQDKSGSIYIHDPTRKHPLPAVGTQVEVRGTTAVGGVSFQELRLLGAGDSPGPVPATWDQLMNGSLDMRHAEIHGVIESLLNRNNGWSRAEVRTRDGILKVELRRAGVTPAPLAQYEGAVVRLRGLLFVDRYANGRVKAGQVRMHDAEITVEQPRPPDVFSIPATSAAALVRTDPNYHLFKQVKVAGQIIFVRGFDHFLMNGPDGLRFVTSQTTDLQAGDLVEVVGYPEMSAAAPVLRSARVRKTGHEELPAPRELSPDDLIRPSFDSTLVSVAGRLASVRDTKTNLVMEIQSGSWRFMARLKGGKLSMPVPEIGSQLRLTGVYCAQGGYKALGEDVAAVDLLLNSPEGIQILATPSWWTLSRVLVMAGVLALLLLAALLWVTQLHRRVEQRTVELQTQIHERERVEQLRAIEQERSRIAHDLHDELGADITEIGMLAARVRTEGSPVEDRRRCLEQLSQKTGQMVSALEEIVWAMNPQHDSLTAVVSYFSFFADRFLGLANIRLRIETAADVTDLTVEARVRHQLFLVFKEALTNVVNHSAATEVRVNLCREDHLLWVTVADNGRGLTGATSHNGQDGIGNMQTRMKQLGGRFEISSELRRGTTLKFATPLTPESKS